MTTESSPLLLEVATDNERREIVRNILNASAPTERKFLIANPWALGIRAEAHLAGVAPEWFAVNDLLSTADRVLLASLAQAA